MCIKYLFHTLLLQPVVQLQSVVSLAHVDVIRQILCVLLTKNDNRFGSIR